MRLAASREVPIPCYAEMGSVNPLFVLPGAMKARTSAIAGGLLASFTMGSGQFCTKPGMVFVPQSPETETFSDALKDGVLRMQPQTMLTKGIAGKYASAVRSRAEERQPALSAVSRAGGGPGCAEPVTLFQSDVATLLHDSSLAEEVFGPTTLLLTYTS